MISYLGRKIAQAVVVLFLVTLGSAGLVDLIPGSPAAAIVGDVNATEAIARVNAEYGLDKPFFERVRPYSPPGWIERRDKPFSTPVRAVWFVLVGWWLGAVWVVVSWSPFLLPYPLFDTVAALLREVPCTMTLAQPEKATAA